MTTKTTKTIVFASLIATLILPFGGMIFAEAQTIPVVPDHVSYKAVKPVISDERQAIINEVAKIGEQLEKTKSEKRTAQLQAELDELKPAMLAHGLTPSFEFGEDEESWEARLTPTQAVAVDPVSAGTTASSSSADWHVKHQLKWGCNTWVYCTENWPEWYNLGDYSHIEWTLPTVYQSYAEVKHLVTNFTGGPATQTMHAWASHVRGETILDSNYDADTEFWQPNEVESEIVLVTWDAQTGDKLYSTSRIT